jgi:hypothetical protein
MDLIIDSILADKTVENLVQSYKTSTHVAVLIKRGQEIARATNRVGSRSRGAGWSDCTIHAERNVVKELGDLEKLRGATLYVFRISRCRAKVGIEKISNSEPCYDCHLFLTKCHEKYGLRRVYYTSLYYSTTLFKELDFNDRPIRKMPLDLHKK